MLCEGMLHLKEELNCVGKQNPTVLLSDVDRWVLEVGVDVVKPFMMTQVQLEGEKYVTGSLTIPMIEQLRVGLQTARDRLQEFETAVGDVAPFSMGEILDGMIEDFNNRWGDGSDLLVFKYGQTGSGKGQPCGYTPEQILQFACDP